MRSHNLFTGLLALTLLFAGVHAYSQAVLDAPFVQEKDAIHEPLPAVFNDQYMYSPGIRDQVKPILEQRQIYPSSHLYAEPEYSRIRVFKYAAIDRNPHLGTAIPHEVWVRAGEGWEGYTKGDTAQRISGDAQQAFDLQPPNWVKRYDNVNIAQYEGEGFFRGKNGYKALKKILDEALEDGYATRDDEGTFRLTGAYKPKGGVVVIPFEEMIRSAFDKGQIGGYADKNFTKPLTRNELLGAVKDKSLKGIRIKEDYFYDIASGRFTSAIIGIGWVGEDKQIGKELLWMYYPELRWAMMGQCTRHGNIIKGYEHIFDAHQYTGEVNAIVQPHIRTWKKRTGDHDYAVKLLPQTLVQLYHEMYPDIARRGEVKYGADKGLPAGTVNYKKGKAHGRLSVSHLKARTWFEGVMSEGCCTGQFKFYYQNKQLQSLRNYSNGRLEGEQRDFYPNGKPYATFVMKDYEIQSLTRYYQDGHLLEKGSFTEGLMDGKWEYHLDFTQIPDSLADKAVISVMGSPATRKNGYVKVELEYHLNYGDHCPPNYTGVRQSDMKRVCCNSKDPKNE